MQGNAEHWGKKMEFTVLGGCHTVIFCSSVVVDEDGGTHGPRLIFRLRRESGKAKSSFEHRQVRATWLSCAEVCQLNLQSQLLRRNFKECLEKEDQTSQGHSAPFAALSLVQDASCLPALWLSSHKADSPFSYLLHLFWLAKPVSGKKKHILL